MSYDFSTLKSFYAVCLREIEVGNKTWEDDFSAIEMVILQKHVPKTKDGIQFGRKSFKSDKKSDTPVDSTDVKWESVVLFLLSKEQMYTQRKSNGSH